MSKLPATSRAARFQPHFSLLDDAGAGVDVERALSRAKFASKILYDTGSLVPARSLSMFIARIASKDGIEDIAFRGATRERFQDLEPWARVGFLNTATLGELLTRYCVVGSKHNTYRAFAVTCDERLARISCRLPLEHKLESWHRFSDWSNVWLFLETIRYVLGETYQPTAITLQSKGALTPEMLEIFGATRLLQGWTCTSVVFPKHLLATPLPDLVSPSRPPKSKVPASVEDPSFAAVMRQLIKPCLSESWLDIHTAADMSGCSVRTFQRRLSDSGLTYKKLLEQTRMEVARSRLADQQDRIIDIGYDVGYTDPSNFTRAFRRAHGVTPVEFRHTNVQL